MKVKMLRVLSGVSGCIFVAALVIASCKKKPLERVDAEEAPQSMNPEARLLVNNYLNSPFYAELREKYQIGNFGRLSWQQSEVEFLDDDKRKPLIQLAFSKTSGVKAILQVIPVPGKFRNVLPGDGRYLTGLVDYTAFDPVTRSGKVVLKDLNYDGYEAADLYVRNGSLQSREIHPMPIEIRNKYAHLLKKKDLGNPVWGKFVAGERKAPIPCDSNGNGNLGFGECYSCFVDACSSEKSCAILCALVNLASSKTPVMAQCTLSILAACAYLAIVY